MNWVMILLTMVLITRGYPRLCANRRNGKIMKSPFSGSSPKIWVAVACFWCEVVWEEAEAKQQESIEKNLNAAFEDYDLPLLAPIPSDFFLTIPTPSEFPRNLNMNDSCILLHVYSSRIHFSFFFVYLASPSAVCPSSRESAHSHHEAE